MIYVKEDNSYLKYHITGDGRLICTEKNGTESVILYDISGEFDAAVSDDGSIHFVLQGLSGELIYLKKEDGTWKKYNIFKSRKGIRRIFGIRLVKSDNELCAFYIMEHTGKNLMVKHIFSQSELYREPEVLDLSDARRDFCICMGKNGETHLFFKNENSIYKNYTFDSGFKLKKATQCGLDTEVLALKAAYVGDELCFAYTVPRKNSTALVFCKADNPNDSKIVTFGISRSCCPEIIAFDNTSVIQWEENGTVMQASAMDDCKSFSKPKILGINGVLTSIRQGAADNIKCDKCAVYNYHPYIHGKNFAMSAEQNKGADNNMNFDHNQNKNDIINDSYCKDILQKLKEIEDDIDRMGKNLEEMCSFLDKLKAFDIQKEWDTISITSKETKKDSLSGSDIGEVYENNIKLFESTDIDEVLPDNSQQ